MSMPFTPVRSKRCRWFRHDWVQHWGRATCVKCLKVKR